MGEGFQYTVFIPHLKVFPEYLHFSMFLVFECDLSFIFPTGVLSMRSPKT